MSQENVELTRRGFQAFNDRDLDALLAGLTTRWRPSRASRVRGSAAESDTPVDTTVWHVNQFRDGKVIRWRVYTSESEALEAVGLSE